MFALSKAFQACPDFKGIKTNFALTLADDALGFKLALISKGLRRGGHNFPLKTWSFKLALISKGLRQCPLDGFGVGFGFQACPDFKGIKTIASAQLPARNRVSSLP